MLAAAFSHDIPCVLITGGWNPPVELLQASERYHVPLLRTPVATPVAIAKISAILDDALAVRQVIHGVLMDILGLGVLIIGDSGIGKSECALDLVVRGHRLVADDTVEVRRRGETVVIGTCPELTRHHMELRGLGVINIRDLFGVASTRSSKRVELVVQLERWDPAREYDRLGLDENMLRDVRCQDPADPHAGRAGPEPRDPRRGRGAESAAAVDGAERRARSRRRGSSASCARPRPTSTPTTSPSTEARCERRGRRADVDRHGRARRRTRPQRARHGATRGTRRFVILTGLSGAGKTQAIRALEDLGYFCVDNLPTQLIPTMAELMTRDDAVAGQGGDRRRRARGRVSEAVPADFRKLQQTPGVNPTLIFLEASHSRAGAAVQRDAAAASAGAGSVGHRRHPRRARQAQ